ncbi:MAG: glucodextranase DOMON-like domain-containing protein [Nocardioides sp.]
MLKRLPRPASALTGAGAVVLALLVVTPGSSGAAAPGPATGGPGTLSRFDLGRKDCVGTARNRASKVWFTVADGVLSDVYEPFIDNTNVHSLQYAVTDGSSFTDLQTRDLRYRVHADRTGMQCTVRAVSRSHRYALTTRYVTDPASDAVVMHTRISPIGTRHSVSGLKVYAVLDSHVNGNGGGGPDNGGADNGVVGSKSRVPVVFDRQTETQAANRDYAVPTYMALTSDHPGPGSVGYAGTTSDPTTSLDRRHHLVVHTSAPHGHIVAASRVRVPKKTRAFTLSLGFGRTGADARKVARQSARHEFGATAKGYRSTWTKYDAGLRQPTGLDRAKKAAYWLDANVLKSSEDKTFPGAIAASLASPWGQSVSAGDLPGGKPVYFGSYREIFGRDLYEAASGLIATGDKHTARLATLFLFLHQQQPAGNMPRNSLLNGKAAPDTGGIQLDETAYPILLAQLTGLGSRTGLYRHHIRPAADYLVSHGPSYGNERWEEQGGYSPSTIAAEIAGLAAAGAIAHRQGDDARSRLYYAVADDFQRTVKGFTVTHNGPYDPKPYFVRLTKDGNPDAGTTYGLGNGSTQADQRAVVDGGFQELARLGELPSDDPDVLNSLKVLDQQIAETTPSGTGYYRYGTDTPGSEDGYGDCWTPDPTNCPADGQPWPTTDSGSGHLWPVLSGERAETALANGNRALAKRQLGFMLGSASGVGLVPEQAWEDPDLAKAPYGTDPTTGSIGFQDGHAAGSASPLTWAQAQRVRLLVDLSRNKVTDRPAVTTRRYVDHAPPANVPMTIDSPAEGSTVSGPTTVSGTTTPGATVTVSLIGNDSPGSSIKTTTAGSDGSWSAQVTSVFGSDVITAAASTAGGTGVDRVDVVGDLVGGTTILDQADPANDDNGPGTYGYPTASDFKDGAFDITRFQVLQQGDTVYLRTTLRDLTPTFGSPLGAQLLDIYVHQPDATSTSTTAAYASRHYTIAPDSAWAERIEVQGFAGPVWVDADGNQVGTVSGVVASQAARTITIAVPASELGTPATGWSFSVVLHGQDGYSSDHDQARGFQALPQDYQFGVCTSGETSPICSVDPNTVAKATDVITPAGVDQATELDPTAGEPMVHGVPVP